MSAHISGDFPKNLISNLSSLKYYKYQYAGVWYSIYYKNFANVLPKNM